MTAKEKHKQKMLEYWGDPENNFINRGEMATEVLKINPRTMYEHFTSVELQEIEKEAVELRKNNSARQRAMILKSLYANGLGGNVQAAKEFLDRTEGKVTEKHENKNDTELVIKWQE